MKELLGTRYLGSTVAGTHEQDGSPVIMDRFYDSATGVAYEVDFKNGVFRKGNGKTWSAFGDWAPLG